MSYKIVTQDPFEFITLEEAKSQCRITSSFTLDDVEITSLISSASDIAQQYCNLLLTEGNVIQYVKSYQSDCFMLFGGNISAINSVKASLNDTEETLPVGSYVLNSVTGDVTVSADYSGYSDFYFDYDCGYSDSTRPPGIKHAVLMLISTAYNHREDFSVGQSVDMMPLSSKCVLQRYRRYVS